MDVICYSAAISACEKCSMWQTAFSVLEDMRRRGPENAETDLKTYSSVCFRRGLHSREFLPVVA